MRYWFSFLQCYILQLYICMTLQYKYWFSLLQCYILQLNICMTLLYSYWFSLLQCNILQLDLCMTLLYSYWFSLLQCYILQLDLCMTLLYSYSINICAISLLSSISFVNVVWSEFPHGFSFFFLCLLFYLISLLYCRVCFFPLKYFPSLLFWSCVFSLIVSYYNLE